MEPIEAINPIEQGALTGSPERVTFRAEELANLPAEARLSFAEPNQWWRHGELVFETYPAGDAGVWVIVLHAVPAERDTFVKAMRETLAAVWNLTSPDLFTFEIAEQTGAVEWVKAAGFKRLGVLPLSTGNRVVFWWRQFNG